MDDFAPTAIEERENGVVRIFFATREQRDFAREALTDRPSTAIDVSDEDWAVRSQQNLTPIVVGGIRVVPDAALLNGTAPLSPSAGHAAIEIVIEPSMGFGTGHHTTTRLCLSALQTMHLGTLRVLDVGTGSGILAIAAARLGAASVLGIDYDADAIQSANQNLTLNRDARQVTFEVADLMADTLPTVDLVMANLTGGTLVRWAARVLAAANVDGTLVLSGILAAEEHDVREAFASAALTTSSGRAGLSCERRQEDEWVCLTVKKV